MRWRVVNTKNRHLFSYDYLGRRLQKIVSTNNGSIYVAQSTNTFVYDGWNLLATVDGQVSLVTSFSWGLDLSGTAQGAGGVGGLLAVSSTTGGVHFASHDGNGNVSALISATDGAASANYEYGPFGELIRCSGTMAKANPFRFSSKYQDDETDLVYFVHRYYRSSSGGWLSRDPFGEDDGPHLYGFVGNNPVTFVDPFGLWKWKGGKRQGGERAFMLPDPSDTTQSAAAFAKLDPSKTEKWLRDSTEHWVKPGEKIEDCLEYDVPNTFVIGVGHSGIASKVLANWQNRLTAALEKRGFYVAPYRFDTGTTSAGMETAARGRDVWGIGLFGHGYKKIKGWLNWSPDPDFADLNGGLAWDDDKSEVITPATIRPHHKFGLVIVYFCYADLNGWSGFVSPNGKYYGGTGSVSALSGPRSIGYWGSWSGLVGGATE